MLATPSPASGSGCVQVSLISCISIQLGLDFQIGGKDAEATTSEIDWQAFDAQQREAARLSHAEQARLILDTGR
jgi:hypothetical protein